MRAHVLVDGRVERLEDPARIREAHLSGRNMWVELGARVASEAELLTSTFELHPLVVEDIFGERSVPKIEAMGRYIYVVVHALRGPDDPLNFSLGVLDVVIGGRFVLTQHCEGAEAYVPKALFDGLPGLLEKGPAWVAHALIDATIDRFLPRMDALKDRIDEAERRAMRVPVKHQDLLPELAALKRAVDPLYRIAAHQGDILRQLSRARCRQIPRDAKPYFRDVYDHFMRVAESADIAREALVDTIDAHLNVQSYRLNATVKRLTLISTVMLPLNLIASFYGMNFRYMPGLTSRWGVVWILAVMVVTTMAIVGYFRLRRWT